MLKSFSILDDLSIASHAGIEVRVELEDGHPRWCFFMTPGALANCGDLIPNTGATIHYAPHMIVVSHISEDIIKEALHYLDARGDLGSCTRAFGV